MESPTTPPSTPNRRTTVLAMIVTVGLYLLPIAGHPPMANPNELVRIELGIAMAMWITVEIEEPARVYGLSEDVALRDGRVLADKAPGLSFAAIPLVWVSSFLLPMSADTGLPQYWPLRHLATALLVALGAALVCFLLAAGIPDARPDDWVALAVILAISTPLWTYGTVFFGHVPAAVLIAIAWILLLRPFTNATLKGGRSVFLGGFSAGFAVTTEYPTVLLVTIIFVTLIVRRTPARRLAFAVFGLVTGLLPALVYHQAAFGSPWLTGYAFKADPGFRDIHASGLSGVSLPSLDGLWGVLFSSSRGLFFYSPVLLLVPLGLWLMHRRHGWRDVAPLSTAGVVYVSFAAGFVDWQAGWCAAARHLVPVIPLLVIPTMVAMVTMARRKWTLLLLTAMIALSATRTVLSMVITPFFPPELSRPFSQFVLPSLRDGVAAPNLVSTITGMPTTLVWIATIGLTAVLLIWGLSRLGHGSSLWIVIVTALMIVGQMAWFAWVSRQPDLRQEAIRSQLLAGLGHSDAAARIDAVLRSNPPSDPGAP